ncbi:MAG: galactose mutarotase [Lachnospiraceae bacterium]|nr:galactose mutarotase [Lachnospiraceae bacterium]
MMAGRVFGTDKEGRAIRAYTIGTDKLRAVILDYGATVQSLFVRGADGKERDIVLGYDNAEGYIAGEQYFGATIGRVANRIAGAEFELNGRKYELAKNERDYNSHGGIVGFDKRIWDALDSGSDYVRMHYRSPDGEEGFPGTLDVDVTFSIEGESLVITYEAVTDKDTILNLTNHSYFNLDGGGSVEEQLLMIRADTFTEIDEAILPTGRILPVKDTALDFREEKPIGKDVDRNAPYMAAGAGYDHNFVIADECRSGQIPFAAAFSSKSGIRMTCFTDQPGVQLYTPDYISETAKGGKAPGRRPAFCLETQHFADAVHHPHFPSIVLEAGERFCSCTRFCFDVPIEGEAG